MADNMMKISELTPGTVPLVGDEWLEAIQKDVDGTWESVRIQSSALKGLKGDKGDPGLSAYGIAQDNGYSGNVSDWLQSLIGLSAYDVAVDEGFVGTRAEWLDSLVGDTGLSAFEVAVAGGFVGTEADWLESLKGKSAYELAVDGGYTGTVSEWLDSLVGAEGKSVYQVAVDGGYTGTEQEWLDTLVGPEGPRGPQGYSPYELALQEGFEGTVEDWLNTLKGTSGPGLKILGSFTDVVFLPMSNNSPGDAYIIDYKMWVWVGDSWEPVGQVGPTGKSAYRVAVDAGFSGSRAQWLASLKGDSAYQIAVDNGFVGSKADWLDSLHGTNGKSAYEIALEEGFAGTKADWLVTLVGPKGEQGVVGPKGDQGDPAAAIKVLGQLATTAELPTSGTVEGDAYFVTRNDPELGVVLDLHVWTGSLWFNAGRISGPQGVQGTQGDQGIQGETGDSAYELAVANGYVGTVSQWLTSLKGEAGKSAYEVAVAGGYAGSETNWLNSLVGADGLSAYELALQNGFTGSETEWIDSLKGEKGDQGLTGAKGDQGDPVIIDGVVSTEAELPANPGGYSAWVVDTNLFIYLNGAWVDTGPFVGPSVYDVAVANGFVGTEAEWLAELEGSSAYQVAVDNGFVGTQADWLLSLVGPKGDKGDKGDQGDPGPSLNIIDTVATEADLPVTGTIGEGYLVGVNLYAWVNDVWKDLGPVKGPQGDVGPVGPDGPSAFDVAVANGFTGTQTDWINSLKGKSAYQISVDNGFGGDVASWLASLQGKSAYQVAVDGGYVGTEAEWLTSLQGAKGDKGDPGDPGDPGADGKSAYQVAVDGGYTGTQQEWLDSLVGAAGASAYDIAVANGFVGTEQEWLDSLNGQDAMGLTVLGQLASSGDLPTTGNVQGDTYAINGHYWTWVETTGTWEDLGDFRGPQGLKGDQGDPGLPGDPGPQGDSAYQVAVNGGYTGTEAEWLASLQGVRGLSAFEVYLENNPTYSGTEQDWLDSLDGNRWILLPNDPDSITGDVNDLALNTETNQYFQKTSDTVWAAVGFLGGGTVYEAPVDGAQYVRKDGAWTLLTADVPEAPADGTPYVRQDAGWIPLVAEVPEAPVDGTPYIRQDAAWTQLVIDATGTSTITGTSITDVSTPAAIHALLANMGITYDSVNGVWVNDESAI